MSAAVLRQVRSYDRSVQLLLLNQFTINLGFYMLMPYLAQHLSGDLVLSAWVIGLILGVRNFSQQGMFLLGGTLADRFGYKPLIVAGCTLRTIGFAALGLVDSLPGLLAASAATGFAGALFNPAVRAYLARDAGERRIEAFALFNVFYQAGILAGPLIGLALTQVDFSLTCLVSAGVFAVLTVVQLRSLPQARGTDTGPSESVLRQWRTVVANRPFLYFAAAMTGSYVLSFQVYLALPLALRESAPPGIATTAATSALFAVSGLATIFGQTRITAWCKERWSSSRSLTVGLVVMGAGFLPMLIPVPESGIGRLAGGTLPAVLSGLLLALATMIVYPFEMDTIVALADNRLVATHYGLYNTICGIGITAGNLLTGAALDAARRAGVPALPWLFLTALGVACALSVRGLGHRTKIAGAGSAEARREQRGASSPL
ncbi:Multidrug resistance protein MdtH [Streptomyces sp. ADI95-16]|uniref:MDR family MFS transporter n=1 Tax=Streptomyces sp. ADI95-16 TaxID=1522758 RepID=UPI000F3A8BE2|nr:MFS transporter [Streptomyces sp. ADI95-16]AYV32167.1 Multidrug resistance protein MdtH [Streptomyces sp. ADI95-16]